MILLSRVVVLLRVTLNDSVISTIESSTMVILTHARVAHSSNDKRVEGREVKSSGDSEHAEKRECTNKQREYHIIYTALVAAYNIFPKCYVPQPSLPRHCIRNASVRY